MSSVKLERGVTVANPIPAAYGENGLNGVIVSVGSHCAGTRLLLRPRFSDFYVNADTCPVPGDFYNLEGPYLRIRPAMVVQGQKDAFANRNGPSDSYSNTAGAAISGKNISQLNPTSDEFYYEIDANNASVFLPFDCQCEIYAPNSGLWLYDVYTMSERWSEGSGNIPNANLKQTRIVRSIGSRIVPVPVGAHTMQCVGDSSVTFTPGFSDAPKIAAGQTDQILGAVVGSGQWPGVPGCLGNSRVVTVSALSEGHDGAVIFGISIP